MSVQGGSVTIAPAGTTASVSFATAVTSAVYQLGFSTTWVTSVTVTSKTTTGFAVSFGTAAPAGGGTFDWNQADTASSGGNVITSATVTVAAGISTSSPVLVSLPASYQVTIATGANWVSAYDVVSKTTTGFTVNFASPAPPGGSTYDYIITASGSGTVSLQDYLTELQDLLHDPNTRFWSQTPQMANYINRAIKRRDLDTGANRTVISFTLTSTVEAYTFSQVNANIYDVYSIVLLFGNIRQVLDNPTYTELTAQGYRYAQGFTGWTAAWAKRSPSTVVFAPAPSTPFVTEWDVALFSLPLVNLTDTDPLPFPYTQPVAFYAAYLAKLNEKNYDEAQGFLDQYMEQLGVATNGRVGRVPNAYSGLGAPWVRRY